MKHLSSLKKIAFGIFIPAVVLFSNNAYSARYSAVESTAWSSAATWSVNRVPDDNDTITIPVGLTVTVDINSPSYMNMVIYVRGTLNFDVGQKINMCPGMVKVYAGGQLTGGVAGSKIDICGETVWNGPGPTSGPVNFYPTAGIPVVGVVVMSSRENSQTPVNGRVGVNWSVYSESANTVYYVERSYNGMTFEKIATVDGKGISSSRQDYSYVDEDAQAGTNYYRVNVSRDGGEPEISERTAAANISSESKGGCVLTVYPNPCVGECTVRFSDCPSDNDGAIVVEMVDANGATVSSTTPERDANGGFTMQIDANNNLAPGMYIVRGSSTKKSYMQKAVLK